MENSKNTNRSPLCSCTPPGVLLLSLNGCCCEARILHLLCEDAKVSDSSMELEHKPRADDCKVSFLLFIPLERLDQHLGFIDPLPSWEHHLQANSVKPTYRFWSSPSYLSFLSHNKYPWSSTSPWSLESLTFLLGLRQTDKPYLKARAEVQGLCSVTTRSPAVKAQPPKGSISCSKREH